jgi:hypothetical protein
LKTGEFTANILVGKEPRKVTIETDISDWMAKTDPMFTTAMDIVQKKIDKNAMHEFVENLLPGTASLNC